MDNTQTPFLDLFHQMRGAGMKLTPEQYQLLRQALDQGHGWKGWDDLRRLCRLLWVKPSPNYDAELFDRTFDGYVEEYCRQLDDLEIDPPAAKAPTLHLPQEFKLPSIPPRRMPSTQAPGKLEAPVAFKTERPQLNAPKHSHWSLTPTALPIQLETVKNSWKSLHRPIRCGLEPELDLEATLDRMNRDGFLSEVVMRPALMRRSELLLLIDDSGAMLPFRPGIQPLIDAVEQHRVTPAQIYRFTTYPDRYLYDWRHPAKAESLPIVLSRLHRSRTVVWVVSDAGAAMKTDSPQRVRGIEVFLERIMPCVRQLLWLNPLPPQRWQHTSAQRVAQALKGRMICLDRVSLEQATRENFLDSMIQVW